MAQELPHNWVYNRTKSISTIPTAEYQSFPNENARLFLTIPSNKNINPLVQKERQKYAQQG